MQTPAEEYKEILNKIFTINAEIKGFETEKFDLQESGLGLQTSETNLKESIKNCISVAKLREFRLKLSEVATKSKDIGMLIKNIDEIIQQKETLLASLKIKEKDALEKFWHAKAGIMIQNIHAKSDFLNDIAEAYVATYLGGQHHPFELFVRERIFNHSVPAYINEFEGTKDHMIQKAHSELSIQG